MRHQGICRGNAGGWLSLLREGGQWQVLGAASNASLSSIIAGTIAEMRRSPQRRR